MNSHYESRLEMITWNTRMRFILKWVVRVFFSLCSSYITVPKSFSGLLSVQQCKRITTCGQFIGYRLRWLCCQRFWLADPRNRQYYASWVPCKAQVSVRKLQRPKLKKFVLKHRCVSLCSPLHTLARQSLVEYRTPFILILTRWWRETMRKLIYTDVHHLDGIGLSTILYRIQRLTLNH